MSSWGDIHSEAMEFTSEAMRAKGRGNLDVAHGLFLKALSSELEALELMGVVDEPIYSTMYRSAATLALDCNDFRLAEKLASKALAGDPPGYLVWELREVVERATFHTHLQLNGIELGEGELYVSVSGGLVSYGQAMWSDFVPRLDSVRKMLRHMWDFATGREHDEMGDSHSEGISIVIGTPVPASMAVTMKIGAPAQEMLAGVANTDEVIAKTLLSIKAVNESHESELARLIPDDTYRRNFMNLVKGVAPDGKRVAQVGFTGVISGQELQVPLRRTRASFESSTRIKAEVQHKSVEGRLLFADGVRKRGHLIKIIDKDDIPQQVVVPSGMMDDIVRPLWNEEVKATCIEKGETVTLESIERAQ